MVEKGVVKLCFCGNIEEMKKANNFTAKHLKKYLTKVWHVVCFK